MIVGYVFSRYPLLSETFILREMWALEQQGHRLLICPLRRATGKRHARTAQLRAAVFWAPWWPWRAHLYWLRRRPGIYMRTLASVLWRNRGECNALLGAVVFWGKAVAIARYLHESGAEHLHAHYITHPGLAAYVVQRLSGIPYTVTVHAHDIFCHRAMLREKVRGAQAVVAISAFNRAWVERAVPPPRPPIPVVHCGIEWEAYAALARGREMNAAPGRALRLLAVGSLQPYKGHVHLIAACAQLREEGVALSCRICGGGELQNRLQAQIATLRLGACVYLDGPATETEVLAALAWADVFVLPSIRLHSGKMEGLPVALMEAMAAGLPIVASCLSGIPELVEDHRTGLLVTPGNAAALAEAVRQLRDPGVRWRMGQAASERVRHGFRLEENAACLARLWAGEAVRHGEVAA